MFNTFYRTNTCGELRLGDAGKKWCFPVGCREPENWAE